MTGPEQSVAARLIRSPYPGRPVAAAATPMPLGDGDEYLTISRITPRNATEIFVAPTELFRLLDSLVDLLLAALPDRDVAFVQLAMPGTTRLPPGLLRDEVLLLPTVERCYRDAIRRGLRPLAVAQDLRRFPTEDSFNRISCRWTWSESGEEAFARLCSWLEAHGFELDSEQGEVRYG